MAHTPGQARYDADQHEVLVGFGGGEERRLNHLEPPDAEDVANLERVALTWNAHDDLLEALEAIGEGRTLVMDDIGETLADALMRDARAAKAKGSGERVCSNCGGPERYEDGGRCPSCDIADFVCESNES